MKNTLIPNTPHLRRALFRRGVITALASLALSAASSTGFAQLIFNFNAAPGTSAQAIAGFQAAGARWSALFDDNATIKIDIAFTNLGAGILGEASSTQAAYTYSQVKSAMFLDQTTVDDATAFANLPVGSVGTSFNLLINGVSELGGNPASIGLDNNGSSNNTTVRMSNANAKALGLLAGNNAATDASISFSDQFTWDFDPSNGIAGGAYDFVGVATHEIGHALGFISGVDLLDFNMPGAPAPGGGTFPSNAFTFVSTLDLFRYSALSVSVNPNAIDWTADTRDKFFSIDGGTTFGPKFSTGVYHGDGRQASHWKDSLGIGIMDPTSAPGELLAISNSDIQAFDVIGWDRAVAVQAAPDGASTMLLIGLTLTALMRFRRTV